MLADGYQVEHRDVGPETVRPCSDGRALVHRREDRAREIAVRRPFHRDDFGAGISRRFAPRVDIGRKLLGQHDDRLTLRERQVACGHRDAVAGRRNEGDVVFFGVDDSSEQGACDFRVGEEVGTADFPGPGLSTRRLSAGVHCRPGQRTQIGAVQVRNVLGDVEQMSLARYHHFAS